MAVIDFLAMWWPVLLLLIVRPVAGAIAVLCHHMVKSRLDHSIADDLPETAGEWLQRNLAESGLAPHVGAIVCEEDDGYRTLDRIIQLAPETHFKADPVYWATAAHELGHARFHVRHPRVSALLAAAARLGSRVRWTGLALTLGNVLCGLARVTELGLLCLAVSLCLGVPALVDEVIASTSAARALRGALVPRHFRAVLLVLFTAFSTYAVQFAASFAFLWAWAQVVVQRGPGLLGGIAAPPTGWRLLGVAIISIAGLAHAASRLVELVSPATNTALAERFPVPFMVMRLGWLLGPVILVVLSWNARTDTAYAWCVLLAVYPALTAIMLLASAPAIFIGVLARRIDARYAEIERSARFTSALARGFAQILEGNGKLKEISQRRKRKVSTFAVATELLYLPLLAIFWMGGGG